jgi:hypothetical protein
MKFFKTRKQLNKLSEMKLLCLKKQRYDVALQETFEAIDSITSDLHSDKVKQRLYDYAALLRRLIDEVSNEIYNLEYK